VEKDRERGNLERRKSKETKNYVQEKDIDEEDSYKFT